MAGQSLHDPVFSFSTVQTSTIRIKPSLCTYFRIPLQRIHVSLGLCPIFGCCLPSRTIEPIELFLISKPRKSNKPSNEVVLERITCGGSVLHDPQDRLY